jgi:hypothetical protein
MSFFAFLGVRAGLVLPSLLTGGDGWLVRFVCQIQMFRTSPPVRCPRDRLLDVGQNIVSLTRLVLRPRTAMPNNTNPRSFRPRESWFRPIEVDLPVSLILIR